MSHTIPKEVTEETYNQQIEELATVARGRAKNDGAGLIDAAHELADGHPWTRDPKTAMKVLKCVENHPDEWKHLVPDGSRYDEVLSILATRALELDIYIRASD